MSNMNEVDKTDTTDIPKELVWNGHKLMMVRWMKAMEKELKRDRRFHTLITRGFVNLRTGKTAVDSHSATLAMHDGTAAELHKHTTLATPFPRGKYIATVARELESTKVLASPSKYGKGNLTASDPSAAAMAKLKTDDPDLHARMILAPDIVEETDYELGQWILARVDHAGEVAALEKLEGGRAMLAHLAERAEALSTRQEKVARRGDHVGQQAPTMRCAVVV